MSSKQAVGFKTIKSIIRGAVNIKYSGGETTIYRFSDEELEMYKKRSERSYKRALSTAGIEIMFNTDSKKLSLCIEVNESTSRRYFSLDISVNGREVGQIKNYCTDVLTVDNIRYPFPIGIFEKEFCLGSGIKCVCVSLPWSVQCKIVNMIIDDGAFVKPVYKNKKILAFGDSITQGYDCLHQNGHYLKKLGDFLGAEVYNKAVGGEMFWPDIIVKDEKISPDHIIVAYGTNDWFYGNSREKIKENCKEFYSHLSDTYPDVPIIALAPIRRIDHTVNRLTGEFREIADMIKTAVTRFDNVRFIDCFDFVPENKEYFSDKYLHPNDKGFASYSDALIKTIENMQIKGGEHYKKGDSFR